MNVVPSLLVLAALFTVNHDQSVLDYEELIRASSFVTILARVGADRGDRIAATHDTAAIVLDCYIANGQRFAAAFTEIIALARHRPVPITNFATPVTLLYDLAARIDDLARSLLAPLAVQFLRHFGCARGGRHQQG